MAKSAKIIILIIIVIVLGVAAFFVFSEKSVAPDKTVNTNNNLLGGDRDEHGCIGSAGYSWCEAKQKCLRTWEEPCSTEGEQAIQNLLAQKYNKPLADVTVKATKQAEDYMAGTVFFAAEGLPTPGEGGMFLAAKKDGVWTLVYDGNGSIDCDGIKKDYQFPAEMLAGFCD